MQELVDVNEGKRPTNPAQPSAAEGDGEGGG